MIRTAELAVFLLLVAWTVIFPLATLLSLAFTLPLAAVVTGRLVKRSAPRSSRARATVAA